MKTLRTLSLLSLALLISVPAFAMDPQPLNPGPAFKPGLFTRSLNAVKDAAKVTATSISDAAVAGYNTILKPFDAEGLTAHADKSTDWAESIDNTTKTGAAKKWTAEQYAKTSTFFAKHPNVANSLYYLGLTAALGAVTFGVKKAYDWIKSKWAKNPVDQQLITAANAALTEKKPCVVDAICGVKVQDDVRDGLIDRAVAIDATIAGYNDADSKEDREDIIAVAQAQVEEFNNFVKVNISSKVAQETSDVSADSTCGSCKK